MSQGAERKVMPQFYAKAEDERRCRDAVIDRQPILITRRTLEGKIAAFTGLVQSVKGGHKVYAGYPLRVTMVEG
jgi:hypothetical protein